MKLFKRVLDTEVVTKHCACASQCNYYAMVTLLFLRHHSQIDEVPIIVETEEQCYCNVCGISQKKLQIQRLVFYLLVDLGAPESHLVLLHLEPP